MGGLAQSPTWGRGPPGGHEGAEVGGCVLWKVVHLGGKTINAGPGFGVDEFTVFGGLNLINRPNTEYVGWLGP